jgi:hypothetical protein
LWFQIGYGAAFTVTVSVPAPTGAFQLRLGNASAAPPHSAVAPAGFYMLFPVQNNIPGSASWVQLVP